MKKSKIISTAIALVLSCQLSAQTIDNKLVDTDKLLTGSDLVFKGKVVDVSYQDSSDGIPHTFVTYSVQDVVLGVPDNKKITLRFMGGQQQKGDIIRFLEVSDVPDFNKGDTDILFVKNNNQLICPLVNCSQGKYRDLNGVVTNPEGVPLLLNSNTQFQLGSHSIASEQGISKRTANFSRSYSSANGESKSITSSSNSMVDTLGFVAVLKQRTRELQQSKKITRKTFSSANIKARFSSPVFKEAQPLEMKGPVMLNQKTHQPQSKLDLKEVEMMRKNGGDPVLK